MLESWRLICPHVNTYQWRSYFEDTLAKTSNCWSSLDPEETRGLWAAAAAVVALCNCLGHLCPGLQLSLALKGPFAAPLCPWRHAGAQAGLGRVTGAGGLGDSGRTGPPVM